MTIGITIIKKMAYRDSSDEEWANVYHVTGSNPADGTAWQDIIDDIINTEKACYPSAVKIVRAYGYNSGSDVANYVKNYSADGAEISGTYTYVLGDEEVPWAGDQAAWIRGRVGTSSTGKPVYVRKYFHGGTSPVGAPNEVATDLRTAYLAHAASLASAGLGGTRTWCSPGGAVVSSGGASTYVTTRTLKRRGKRPS